MSCEPSEPSEAIAIVPERHIAKSEADDAPIEPTILSDAHILIVDDDAQLRQLVSRLLRAEGYRATAVAGGREMLEMLRTTEIDLIVLDVMLPGTSGLELCRHVRQSSSVPILMLTASSEETDRVLGLEMGADDYLTKPFGSRELLARIRASAETGNDAAQPGQAVHPAPRTTSMVGLSIPFAASSSIPMVSSST